jgi:plasmid stabilization system protein ParE
MNQVRITPEAKTDLFQIWEYIASKSGVNAADKVLAILQQEISKIGEVSWRGPLP